MTWSNASTRFSKKRCQLSNPHIGAPSCPWCYSPYVTLLNPTLACPRSRWSVALWLLGELFTPRTIDNPYARICRYSLGRHGSVTSHARNQPRQSLIFIPKDLSLVSHAFLRIDAVKPPLQSRYESPYAVFGRREDPTLSIKTSLFYITKRNWRWDQATFARQQSSIRRIPRSPLVPKKPFGSDERSRITF